MRRSGPHSDLVCFSFHPRKLVTTGDGGMILTSNPAHAERLRLLRQHGMSVNDRVRNSSATVVRESYVEVAYNYRLTDIQAAMGIEQLRRLPAMLLRRQELAARYDKAFADDPVIRVPEVPAGVTWNVQSYAVRLDGWSGPMRDAVMQQMLDDGDRHPSRCDDGASRARLRRPRRLAAGVGAGERLLAGPAPVPVHAGRRARRRRSRSRRRRTPRRIARMTRRLPDFIIGGAPRSGTTWLASALDRHPEIWLAKPFRPEPKFFLVDELYAEGLDAYSRRWFADAPDLGAVGEKSTNYLESAAAAARIAGDLPRVRLLFVLREPTARALSNYRWSVMNGMEHEDFATALDLEQQREDESGTRAQVRPAACLLQPRPVRPDAASRTTTCSQPRRSSSSASRTSSTGRAPQCAGRTGSSTSSRCRISAGSSRA